MVEDVTVNHDQELYVIAEGDGYSCLGFDVAIDRIERILIELAGRGVHIDRPRFTRGDIRTYDIYRMLMDRLKSVCDEQNDRAVFDLTPQLLGLEGHRVRVVHEDGTAEQFIVGKSTGWAPVHLKIMRSNAHGGQPAERTYQRVSDLGRVR